MGLKQEEDNGMHDLGADGLATQLHSQRKRLRVDDFSMWCVTHPVYEVGMGIVILLNAFQIGWESVIKGQRLLEGQDPDVRHWPFVVLSYTFCIIFTVDIVFRICAFKRAFLFVNGRFARDARWNIFDSVCVLGLMVELIMRELSDPGIWKNSSIIRMIRMVRIIRVFNVLRTISTFRDLRIMVSATVDSLVPLMWFVIIVFLLLASLGVVLTTAAVDYIWAERLKLEAINMPDTPEMSLLEHYYGTLMGSVASLFMAITGGKDWDDVLEPLRNLHWLYIALFYAYIAFTLFAMINVGSAIFLDAVLTRSKTDRDFVIDEMTQEKKVFMKLMDNLFFELDNDKSGQISLNELREYLSNDEIASFLRALRLDVKQVAQLFRLMDSNQSGTIDRQEFREGCDKLRGEARQLDLAILQQEVGNMKKGLRDLMGVTTEDHELVSRLRRMSSGDRP
jgi:hypothetical protein